METVSSDTVGSVKPPPMTPKAGSSATMDSTWPFFVAALSTGVAAAGAAAGHPEAAAAPERSADVSTQNKGDNK